MTDNILKYLIFEDDAGKIHLSVKDVEGEIILVPQFTLAVNTSKSNRPSFSHGCPPDIAKEKFKYFVNVFKSKYAKTQTRVLAADIKVSLVNNGPVTFSFKA
jgi:D-tyrosyl-tRNA(Tyr) deacylase